MEPWGQSQAGPGLRDLKRANDTKYTNGATANIPWQRLKAEGSAAEMDVAGRQKNDGNHEMAPPQDVVVSKIGTQYGLSKLNYRLIIYNFAWQFLESY
jgi:hypothetical protein